MPLLAPVTTTVLSGQVRQVGGGPAAHWWHRLLAAVLVRSLDGSLAHAGTRRIPDAIAAAGSCHTAIAVFIGRNPMAA